MEELEWSGKAGWANASFEDWSVGKSQQVDGSKKTFGNMTVSCAIHTLTLDGLVDMRPAATDVSGGTLGRRRPARGGLLSLEELDRSIRLSAKRLLQSAFLEPSLRIASILSIETQRAPGSRLRESK